MSTNEVLKLALEALVRSRKAVSGDLDLAGCAYGKNDSDGHRYADAKTALVTLDKAITALREALAEQPAQQEPVAWGVDWGRAGDIPCVSIIKRMPGGGIEVVAVEYAPYSYTSPPAQRTWVGLTDEEIDRALDAAKVPELPGGYESIELEIARAIEAKLKEKNT